MINQDCEEYKNWINVLSDPINCKTTNQLEDCNNPKSRCCLGHACAANPHLASRTERDGAVLYNNDSALLPVSLCIVLNIDAVGGFTNEGFAEAMSWIDKSRHTLDHSRCSPFDLAKVNDLSSLSSQDIGELIKYLAKIEKEQGIEMFKRYSLSEL
jgi:hypothetical protein